MAFTDYLPDWAASELRELRRAPIAAIVVFIIGVGLGFWAAGELYKREINFLEQVLRLGQAQQQTQVTTQAFVWTSRYLVAGAGVVFLVGVMAGVIARSWFRDTEQPQKGPFIRGLVVVGQSVGINRYSVRINGASLRDFRDRYNVAIVRGLLDTLVDKFEDTRIAVSAPFTIVQDDIEITVPEIAALTAAHKADVENAWKQIQEEHQDLPAQVVMTVEHEIKTWQEVVLLPKGVPTSEIRKLSDVPRFLGCVLTTELQEGRIKPLGS